MANAFSTDRYQVWSANGRRSAYLWHVIDTDRHGKIVARTSQRDGAESIAKQLNEKGFVESI
jgi:hypothetical protein